jgi:hypothetical protein
MKSLAGSSTPGGNFHMVGFLALSVRNQPERFSAVEPRLRISIQSEVSPSSSLKVLRLEAMNSLMMMSGGGALGANV